MNKRKFNNAYYFILRVIRSCKTTEQLQSAQRLAWSFIDRDWSVFDDYVWSHLRIIAKQLDDMATELKASLMPMNIEYGKRVSFGG